MRRYWTREIEAKSSSDKDRLIPLLMGLAEVTYRRQHKDILLDGDATAPHKCHVLLNTADIIDSLGVAASPLPEWFASASDTWRCAMTGERERVDEPKAGPRTRTAQQVWSLVCEYAFDSEELACMICPTSRTLLGPARAHCEDSIVHHLGHIRDLAGLCAEYIVPDQVPYLVAVMGSGIRGAWMEGEGSGCDAEQKHHYIPRCVLPFSGLSLTVRSSLVQGGQKQAVRLSWRQLWASTDVRLSMWEEPHSYVSSLFGMRWDSGVSFPFPSCDAQRHERDEATVKAIMLRHGLLPEAEASSPGLLKSGVLSRVFVEPRVEKIETMLKGEGAPTLHFQGAPLRGGGEKKHVVTRHPYTSSSTQLAPAPFPARLPSRKCRTIISCTASISMRIARGIELCSQLMVPLWERRTNKAVRLRDNDVGQQKRPSSVRWFRTCCAYDTRPRRASDRPSDSDE